MNVNNTEEKKRITKEEYGKELSDMEALAEKANMHRTYIGMIERGERNPALLNLIRLASALDISLPELLTFKDYVNDGNCDNESN